MRKALAIALAALALSPMAFAEESSNSGPGIETIFNNVLTGLCDGHSSLATIPIGGMGIEIPGLSDFGLDIRPLCQYADIVNKGTRTIKDLRNGTLNSAENLVNDALTSIAGMIGGRVGTEQANDIIDGLDDQLQTALNADEAFLGAFRDATNQALEQLRDEAISESQHGYIDAQSQIDDVDSDDPDAALPSLQVRRDAFIPTLGVNSALIESQIAVLEQDLHAGALVQASSDLIEEQLESNAYQQTIEDTLRVGALGEEGVAQRIVSDAQSATSVRQSINVLSQAVAGQLRNDAVFSGAVVENLQANARQQAITNHQLGILASDVIREQETELAEAEAEFNRTFSEATDELAEAIGALTGGIEDLAYVTSSDPIKDIGFSFCNMFGDC